MKLYTCLLVMWNLVSVAAIGHQVKYQCIRPNATSMEMRVQLIKNDDVIQGFVGVGNNWNVYPNCPSTGAGSDVDTFTIIATINTINDDVDNNCGVVVEQSGVSYSWWIRTRVEGTSDVMYGVHCNVNTAKGDFVTAVPIDMVPDSRTVSLEVLTGGVVSKQVRVGDKVKLRMKYSACGIIDIVFLLDSSSSVLTSGFNKMKDFVKQVIEKYGVIGGSIRVGLMTYNNDIDIRFHLKDFSNKADILDAIDDIDYRGVGTDTANAISTARTQMFTPQNGDRPGVLNMLILLTDGESNVPANTRAEAQDARAANIRILAIGINTDNDLELKDVASLPLAETVFLTTNFDELAALVNRVAICSAFWGVGPVSCEVSDKQDDFTKADKIIDDRGCIEGTSPFAPDRAFHRTSQEGDTLFVTETGEITIKKYRGETNNVYLRCKATFCKGSTIDPRCTEICPASGPVGTPVDSDVYAETSLDVQNPSVDPGNSITQPSDAIRNAIIGGGVAAAILFLLLLLLCFWFVISNRRKSRREWIESRKPKEVHTTYIVSEPTDNQVVDYYNPYRY